MSIAESSSVPVDGILGVSAEGVSRRFGTVHAVEHIDFHAPPGKVTALIGPNGAGKTTLLLMLAFCGLTPGPSGSTAWIP
jgi:ABC-type multidrug transport system ATPase subunit